MATSSTAAPKPASAASSSTSTSQSPKTRSTSSTHSVANKTTAHKTTAHKSSAHTAGRSRSKKGTKKSAKKRGQQAIDPTRAREIQEALIREHYLDGEPSGAWDSATQAAMQRYQQDRGWQSKTTPDSRALIKLGLGPSHDHLLNPESAMTSTTSTAAPIAPAADPKDTSKPTPAPENIPQQ